MNAPHFGYKNETDPLPPMSIKEHVIIWVLGLSLLGAFALAYSVVWVADDPLPDPPPSTWADDRHGQPIPANYNAPEFTEPRGGPSLKTEN